jgi:glycosyltransferase involved in cell wall biosynthesis
MTKNKKIQVLVVPSDRTGVGYFRSTKPHIALEEKYPDEFHVDIEYEPDLNNDEWLKQYDIIHYHRTLGQYDQLPSLLSRLDNLGIVSIMDLDDHWSPGPHHPAHLLIKKTGLDKLILNNLRISRNITTTTSVFAEEISKYNKNVFILPNAIDPNEKQYIPTPEKSDRVRIGWLGGSSHLKDLEILQGVVGRLKNDGLSDKFQFVLCGFDLRGTMTMIDEQTGQQTQRPIKPMESVWYQYEKIFTDNYSTISPEYKEFLLKFEQTEYPNIANEPYRRVWTKPISTYATNYNLFDVSLAPIEENVFNKVKSQLKVIEAGFHKKAIIAQNFGPYQIDLKNSYQFGGGWDKNGNSILIDTNKNHKDWYKFIKKLIETPELVQDLSQNLYNTVKDTYSVDKVNESRRDLYIKLLNDKKEKINQYENVNEVQN